jgi:hypothetical protein
VTVQEIGPVPIWPVHVPLVTDWNVESDDNLYSTSKYVGESAAVPSESVVWPFSVLGKIELGGVGGTRIPSVTPKKLEPFIANSTFEPVAELTVNSRTVVGELLAGTLEGVTQVTSPASKRLNVQLF